MKFLYSILVFRHWVYWYLMSITISDVVGNLWMTKLGLVRINNGKSFTMAS